MNKTKSYFMCGVGWGWAIRIGARTKEEERRDETSERWQGGQEKFIPLSGGAASTLTSCTLEDTEGLTPVQATTSRVWLLCLHHCNHPVYPAAHHRQVRHHHRTTVHFPQTLIFFFTTWAGRSSLLPANGPLPSVNQRAESGLASFFIFAKSWRWNFHFVMTTIPISSSLYISSKTPTFLCVFFPLCSTNKQIPRRVAP